MERCRKFSFFFSVFSVTLWLICLANDFVTFIVFTKGQHSDAPCAAIHNLNGSVSKIALCQMDILSVQ